MHMTVCSGTTFPFTVCPVNKTEKLVHQHTMNLWTSCYHRPREISSWSMFLLPVVRPRDPFTSTWKVNQNSRRNKTSCTCNGLLSISRDSLENFSQNSDPFLRWSTITSLSAPGATQQPQAFRPSWSTEETLELSCHRRSDGSFVSGILHSPISGPQARLHLQAHHRSKKNKYLSGHSFIQNGIAVLNYSSSSTTRMDYQNRPQRCLSSHPSSCEHPQVLLLCYSWKNQLSVPCSPVWSLNGPLQVHQNFSPSGSSCTNSGNPGPCLSGRFDHPHGFTRSECSTYPDDHQPLAISRMDNKLKKVYVGPLMHHRLPGGYFDLEKAIISPPESFLVSLTQLLSRLSSTLVMPVRKRSSITSRIPHFAPLIHHGRLQLRCLQFWIKQHWAQYRQSWDTPLQLDAEFLSHLRWFNRQDVLKGVQLHLPEPNLFFFTNASLTGWGASWQDRHLSGQWSPQDSNQHINCQLAGTRSHPSNCSPVGTALDQSDSSRLLLQQYGSSSYTQAVKDPFHITARQNAGTISPSGPFWISTHPNSPPRSQECSRRCPVSTEQSKSDRMAASSGNLTQAVLCLRDPLVDMFASEENRVTPIYISPYPDDRAWAVNALSISWDGLGLVYAFPPAPSVPKTPQKMKDSHGTTVILIASQNSSRPWYPLLPLLSQRPHIPLTDVALYMYVPTIRRPQFHREPHVLDLAVWTLSGTSWNNLITQMQS